MLLAALLGFGKRAHELRVAEIAATVFDYAVTTQHAVDRGIFNFDSLWYHMPFAVEMVQSHSVVGMHHTDTVFTNWFYPQNSELLHSAGILFLDSDFLSPLMNIGWMALCLLAAWCFGRPYGAAAAAVLALAVILDAEMLLLYQPGDAKNDTMGLFFLLCVYCAVRGWQSPRP